MSQANLSIYKHSIYKKNAYRQKKKARERGERERARERETERELERERENSSKICLPKIYTNILFRYFNAFFLNYIPLNIIAK